MRRDFENIPDIPDMIGGAKISDLLLKVGRHVRTPGKSGNIHAGGLCGVNAVKSILDDKTISWINIEFVGGV